MSKSRGAIAIVTPWYGAELTGGAERTAWQIAHGLAERNLDITVFSTCARSFASDWGVDAFRPGEQREDGISVRRFAVDSRDRNIFDRANAVLLGQPTAFFARHAKAVGFEVSEDFFQHSINSGKLISTLRSAAHCFEAIIILPYPYGLCIAAIHAAAGRALLLPCLHDESYAYLPAVADAFRASKIIAFNTRGERRLACRIFGPAIALKSIDVGQWIEPDTAASQPAASVNGFDPRRHRYLLYLGRRDDTKNIEMLVESFATFRRRERMSALELVLAGPGRQSYADARHGIVDLAEVNEAEKAALLGAALALVQPSMNESFSRVVIEAWTHAVPVIVNARCEATADIVVEAGGGWTATSKAQWSSSFHTLDRLAQIDRQLMGSRGQRYVEEQTSRDHILDRLESAVSMVRDRAGSSRFDAPPVPALTRHLGDGHRMILYAGPLVETSCIEQLLTGFAFLLSFGIDARLTLLGAFDSEESLSARFFELIGGAGLADRVLVFETSQDEVAAACYRSADLFWSMAEDGPRNELIEALGYGVPIFAFANQHAVEALDTCGLLFNDKTDPRSLAGVAALILSDQTLVDTLAEGQRRRFEALIQKPEFHLAG